MVASSFKWSDFLAVAKQLEQGSEANWRTAISRAYYAAFHPARAYTLAREGRFSERKSEHDQTWTRFSSSSERAEAQLGQWGNDLKRLRVKADYHLTPPMVRRDVLQAISYARKIVEQIEKFRNPQEDA